MAFRQENPNIDDIVPEVKRPDWVPDLSAQNGFLGRLATWVMAYPRLAFTTTAVLILGAFLFLAPILVAAFYILLGAGGYALWSRIRRLRMPRVIPLSHKAEFRLGKPRQDLAQLVMLNLVAVLFTFFGGVMVWDGNHMATGATVAVAFGGFSAVLLNMTLKEIRGRLFFR